MPYSKSDIFVPVSSARKGGAAMAVARFFLGVLIIMGMQGCAVTTFENTVSTAKDARTSPSYPKPYKVMGKWYQPLPNARNFRQRGLASWYGKKFHGRRTSNGERYNMYGISAAHKTLPMGTMVRVFNLKNNKEAMVRINDRGPFVRGRIIDLSYGAAKMLGVVGPGTTPVEIVAVGVAGDTKASVRPGPKPVDYYTGNFTFQVGAFIDLQNARRLVAYLDKTYQNAHITVFDNGTERFYRVRVGQCFSLEKAKAYEALLIQNGFPDVITVAE